MKVSLYISCLLFIILQVERATAVLSECPLWICDDEDFEDDDCAIIGGGGDFSIMLNEDECDTDGTYCLKEDIDAAYKSLRESGKVYGRVKCTTKAQSPKDLVETLSDTDVSCGVRDEKQELETGEHPKQCATGADCRMQNGDDGTCLCGMDSKYWCKAEWGSEVFDDFWDDCDDDATLDGLEYAWWKYKYDNYVTLETAPDCADDVLYEWDYEDELKDEAFDSAIVVAGITFLSLFTV